MSTEETIGVAEVAAFAQIRHPETGEWVNVEETAWHVVKQPVEETTVSVTLESGEVLKFDGGTQVQARARIRPKIR